MSLSSTPYLELEDADDFLLRIADVAAWSAATDAQKSAALLQASDEIDAEKFAGEKYDADQDREFPRFAPDAPSQWPEGKSAPSGVVWDWDDATSAAVVPDLVKLATLAQAISILAAPSRANRLNDQHDGVTGQSAGGVSESYNAARPPQTLCRMAMRLVGSYLLKSGRVI